MPGELRATQGRERIFDFTFYRGGVGEWINVYTKGSDSNRKPPKGPGECTASRRWPWPRLGLLQHPACFTADHCGPCVPCVPTAGGQRVQGRVSPCPTSLAASVGFVRLLASQSPSEQSGVFGQTRGLSEIGTILSLPQHPAPVPPVLL